MVQQRISFMQFGFIHLFVPNLSMRLRNFICVGVMFFLIFLNSGSETKGFGSIFLLSLVSVDFSCAITVCPASISSWNHVFVPGSATGTESTKFTARTKTSDFVNPEFDMFNTACSTTVCGPWNLFSVMSRWCYKMRTLQVTGRWCFTKDRFD